MKPLQTLREQVPLAPLTTIQLGGPARYFAAVRTVGELAEALAWADGQGLPVQLLGGGSNTVFADEGFAGMVLQMAARGFTFRESRGDVLCVARAGTEWDDLVAAATARGLGGIECLSGIPGSVGATPVQNVGAYGQEVAERLLWVRVFERETGKVRKIQGERCDFGYRQSRFKGPDRDRFVILSVALRLSPDASPHLGYREVAERAASLGVDRLAPGEALTAVRRIVLELRRGKSMLRDPEDENARSVGSFFLNPVLSRQAFAALRERLGPMADAAPVYPAPDGVKVSAAWLIGAAGFHRGQRQGGVGISERHTLALVNRGGSTRDLLGLAEEIRRGVWERFGVQLQPEPVIVPFDPRRAIP